MDKIYNEEGITFNDLPQAMSVMLRKVENMEQAIVGLREDIKKTKVCPLARVIRNECRRRGIEKLKVVYSKEEPITNPDNIIGSVPFVPSVAGLIIAGEVIKELI